ncbi:hypothetical protein FB451DRAFT_1179151 [Mycena latifolia]|nr:hypothetical protein FB451DRAFT_1179151 [Mycena latifolia]
MRSYGALIDASLSDPARGRTLRQLTIACRKECKEGRMTRRKKEKNKANPKSVMAQEISKPTALPASRAASTASHNASTVSRVGTMVLPRVHRERPTRVSFWYVTLKGAGYTGETLRRITGIPQRDVQAFVAETFPGMFQFNSSLGGQPTYLPWEITFVGTGVSGRRPKSTLEFLMRFDVTDPITEISCKDFGHLRIARSVEDSGLGFGDASPSGISYYH